MSDQFLKVQTQAPLVTLTLNDPGRRNALGLAMFEALDEAIETVAANQSIHVILLRGEGAVFCAGFDLEAAAADPALMEQFIGRLSTLNRALRRLPQVVVASVPGAAIAGGCALLSACDFVVVAADAKLGYPVHSLGVSPAVTIPTLQQAIGPGAARALLMSGELIDGATAHRLGLATHLAVSNDAVFTDALTVCHALIAKPPNALRTTKRWLNELDGSRDDAWFDDTARASAEIASSPESRMLLQTWQNKRPAK